MCLFVCVCVFSKKKRSRRFWSDLKNGRPFGGVRLISRRCVVKITSAMPAPALNFRKRVIFNVTYESLLYIYKLHMETRGAVYHHFMNHLPRERGRHPYSGAYPPAPAWFREAWIEADVFWLNFHDHVVEQHHVPSPVPIFSVLKC